MLVVSLVYLRYFVLKSKKAFFLKVSDIVCMTNMDMYSQKITELYKS